MNSGKSSSTYSDHGGDILRKLLLPNEEADSTPENSTTVQQSSPNSPVSFNAESFQVDRNSIKAVPKENQAMELQELGLSVYDQETLEKGIMKQLDEAMEKENMEKLKILFGVEVKSVQEEIKVAEEEVLNYELSLKNLPLKNTLSDVNEALLLRRQIDEGLAKINKLQSKEKSLLGKRNMIDKDMCLENEVNAKKGDNDMAHGGLGFFESEVERDLMEENKETEKQKMVRLGQMTPFGTILSVKKPVILQKKNMLSDFDIYLQSQADLKKRKRINQLKTEKPIAPNHEPGPSGLAFSKKQKKQNVVCSGAVKTAILKRKVLHPKKKKGKDSLGTDTQYLDYRAEPGPLPSETTAMNLESSGSEYIPSAFEESSGEEISVHKQRPYKKARKQNVTQEEWHTDDSDWEYSDDETLKHQRKRRRKVIDDGNLEDYLKRLRLWEKEQNVWKKEKEKQEINGGRDEKSEDDSDNEFQELDGGLKIPSYIWDKLFSYQKVGVQWMWELHQQKCGGILGDEMGLGKTIEIVAFFAGLSSSPHKSSLTGWSKGLGPSLVICPTTMLHQWVKEFHEWFPPLRIAIMHDSGSFSGKGGKRELVKSVRGSPGVIVTSYEGLSRQADDLSLLDWHVVVLDEGHVIRNPDARITLAAKRLRTPHRLLLSGSPLQNNLRELWSLFDFIYPGKLGTLPVFTAEFAIPITQGGYATASQVQVITGYKCATVLKDTIAPFLLRRMKSDVKDHINLPTKNEQVLFCRLTDEQREVYREYIKSGDIDRILTGTLKVFVGLINLRKICNHPHLYTGGPKLFKWNNENDFPEHERYGYWKKSGKMIVVENLLRIWHRQGHRVLLFTQGRQMMCILENFIVQQGYTYLKLDGSTSISARQPLINEFNKNASYFVFLLTTRVGGLGINLTGANRVLIYDPDWNPATDTQARERAWRPGQQRHVTVYRLVTAGTIEEKIYHRQIFKQFLTDRVLRDPRRRRFFKSNDLYELFTLHEDGDDLGKHGAKTETSAIFAGTGSEICVSDYPLTKKKKCVKAKLKEAANEDVRTERREKETIVFPGFSKTVCKGECDTQDVNEGKTFTCRKLNSETGCLRSNQETKSMMANQDGKDQVIIFSKEKIEMMKKMAQSLSEKIGQQAKHIQAPVVSKKNGHDEVTNTDACPVETYSCVTIKKVKRDVLSKTRTKSEESNPHSLTVSNHTSHKLLKKKKNKKHQSHKKDCMFEGERVAHLVGVGEASSKSTDVKDTEELNQSQDDYVLKKLFSKSGLQTALCHDVIMDGGDADYALVEGEADRVAHEAVRALKESRRNCWAASSGVPTWTGQSGSLCQNSSQGKPKPLRFGKKRNQFPVMNNTPSSALDPSTSSHTLSSQELLIQIRNKESLLDYFRWKKRMKEEEQNGNDGTNEDYNPASTGVTREQADLLDDIRVFVACGAACDGQATTSEILTRFRDRLPPCATPQLFKSMLRSICDLENQGSTGSGLWKLKPEFRD